MELPSPLRMAVDEALEGVALAELAKASAALSDRYRGEKIDGALHLASDLTAKAYLATRLPATYAAIHDAMTKLAEIRPDFAPFSLLDAGAGPGTALWAASDCWPSLEQALLLEASNSIRQWGEKLASASTVTDIRWQAADVSKGVAKDTARDLVCLAYVLSELPGDRRPKLIEDLWALTADMLLIVEPGTPSGWERILESRHWLIEHGAHIVAPCPHALPCPIAPPDWCHFSRRVARSRIHRLAKNADVPWEDEKFIYLAASRHRGRAVDMRILAPLRTGKGHIDLKLCCDDGTLQERTMSKRDGTSYKRARRRSWGDQL